MIRLLSDNGTTLAYLNEHKKGVLTGFTCEDGVVSMLDYHEDIRTVGTTEDFDVSLNSLHAVKGNLVTIMLEIPKFYKPEKL